MQKTSGCFLLLSNLLWVVLFAVLGGIIGHFSGKVIVSLYNQGFFTHWRLLKSPYKISHIVGTDGFDRILVQTDGGKHFFYFSDSGEAFGQCDARKDRCEVWVEVESPSIEKWSQESKTDCSFQDIDLWNSPSSPPPLVRTSDPIECTFVFSGSPSGGKHYRRYYVLLDNGQVWMWKIEHDAIDDYLIYLAMLILGIFVGGIYGMSRPK